jgi:hypothetical protein
MNYFGITELDNRLFDKVIATWQEMLVTNPEASIRLAHLKVVSDMNRKRTNAKRTRY